MNTVVETPFIYRGPQALQLSIVSALSRVVDPELALNIVDLGLVYGVDVSDTELRLQLTMTSVACPVSELIIDEVENALDAAVPPALRICVELVWEPPWSEALMSERARRWLQC